VADHAQNLRCTTNGLDLGGVAATRGRSDVIGNSVDAVGIRCDGEQMGTDGSFGEVALTVWGSGDRPSDAALVDGVVLKRSGRWAPFVIALLRHLEAARFDGAPRVVGDGYASDGRLTVSFVPGSSAHPGAWADDQVGRVGELLRRLQDATVDFEPPPGAEWQPTWLRDVGAGCGQVFSHCDTGPWNIVGRDGAPEAFIDWEYAGPVDPITELAHTAWLNAQLHDDDVAERHGLPDARTRAGHLRAILDGYGLARADRPGLVDRMIEVAVRSAGVEAARAVVTPESTAAVAEGGYPVLWGIAWRARSASWLVRHRSLLQSAVA